MHLIIRGVTGTGIRFTDGVNIMDMGVFVTDCATTRFAITTRFFFTKPTFHKLALKIKVIPH
jgi:hypothetical protein